MKGHLIIIGLLALTLPSPNAERPILNQTNQAIESFGEPTEILARRGCCSWHGGVCGCSFGRVVCCDGTFSPSCDCKADTPESPITDNCDTEGNLLVSDSSEGVLMAQGYQYVRPYTRRNGTYVPGHYRTNPDGNVYNNWSTRGNVNPFTGQPGYRNPYPSYKTTPTPQYYNPHKDLYDYDNGDE
jgi:hypothetical protein